MSGANNSQRFHGPSEAIDLKRLEKESRKLLVLGLIVAVSFHAAAGAYYMLIKTEVKVSRPLMMNYVISPPLMMRTLDKRVVRIKDDRTLTRKSMVRRSIPADIQTKPISMVDYFVDIEMPFDFDIETVSPPSELFLPHNMFIETAANREPENRISMKEEMISIDDLDTGRYKAMIIQDPGNKQRIKGFIYLSTVWGAQLKQPDELKRSIIGLAEAVNKYTNINAKMDAHLYLDSRKLFDAPFVYVMADSAFELTEIERRNFGEYLRNGGFAVLDNGTPEFEYGQAEASLRQMLKDSLGAQAKFLPIPNDHPVYHCFFDFDDGPPLGAEIQIVQTTTTGEQGERARNAHMSKPVLYLEGIWLDDRLVAIYSDKGYAVKWKQYYNNNPQLKMGVNFVVFALTQTGGIAQRKMDLFSVMQ